MLDSSESPTALVAMTLTNNSVPHSKLNGAPNKFVFKTEHSPYARVVASDPSHPVVSRSYVVPSLVRIIIL